MYRLPVHSHRFWRDVTLLVAAVTAVGAACYVAKVTLAHDSVVSGWVLLASVVLLALLGVRKRLPMLPLRSTRFWVRTHILTGFFAVVVYVIHAPSILANGWFESCLSGLFLIVSGSGVYGLYLSKTVPKKLTAIPGEYRYDRLGWHRTMVASVAEQLIEKLEPSADEDVLTDFYQGQLRAYFAADVGPRFLLFPSGARRRLLIGELNELNRYLSPELRQQAGRLAALIRTRDDLDFHHALQMRLRLWLTVHAGLTFSLCLLIAIHVVLVLQFKGV